DERIASFLDGDREFDARIRDCVDVVPETAAEVPIAVDPQVVERLLSSIRIYGSSQAWEVAPTFYLHGPPSASKILVAQSCCRALDIPILQMDAEQLSASPLGFQAAMPLVMREAFLQGAALYVDKIDLVLEQDPASLRLRSLMQCLDAHRGAPTFLVGERPWRWALPAARAPWLPVQLHRPAYPEQIATWQLALGSRGGFSARDASWLASIHPLPAPRAMAAVRSAEAAAVLSGNDRATLADVVRACRELSQPNFGQLARKIEGNQTWDDLVLPAAPLQQLRDICVQAKYRCHVYGTWGFDAKLPLGKGLNVLFAGPSGTGKTMSAQIIANDLGVDVYKIDLSQVVSKYIGETEKNLHQIFATAQAANVILFFDEADALLAKRSDVKDAHDRYANLEVAYLLQKMEEYEGITILATNLRRNIDEAFARRIRFIVEFPAPSEEDRLRIWQGIWPKELPLSSEVEFTRLARQFKLSGGSIRNVAVCAAFLAAEPNEPVGMRHLTVAVKRELQKMGRLLDDEYCEGQGEP
ncbi:MAG TPA: ATP-binding protein, partial [Polyangiaceae bacterium]